MGNLLFRKTVDQSLLKAGMTVPAEIHQKILEEMGIALNKGEKQSITITIQDRQYEAMITFVNHGEAYANRNVLQIRYGAKSRICQALNAVFAYSAEKIAQAEQPEERKQLSAEEEYIEVYAAGEKALTFQCHTKDREVPEGAEEKIKIKPVLEQLLNHYVKSRQETFAGHALAAYIRGDAPEALYETGLVDRRKYLITGSAGQGNWAMVPWLGIFYKEITTSATHGVYIVYLLAEDGNTLYLTLNQGCTETRKQHSKRETIRLMREKAGKIVAQIDNRGFAIDEYIDLGEGLTELGEMYQNGTIFYQKYTKGNVPEEAELREDLARMMAIYQEYVSWEQKQQPEGNTDPEPQGEEPAVKEVIAEIRKYVEAHGFSYREGLIENFYLSLKSKPFVILAGTSGTGKTRLVRLFAEAVGAASAEGGNGRYKLVSVRPDWSDSSDLFGHTNLKGEFVPGAIIDFIQDAGEHLEVPYFLCLDEMNLARVEYYLSDFLSIIETRRHAGSRIVTDQIVLDQAAKKVYGKLTIPENLYVVGTVNMDETTFPFSKKVLDRANTIEFSYVDLEPEFDLPQEEAEPVLRSNQFLKTEYLVLKADIKEEQRELAVRVCAELQEINKILQEANSHVGYRVRDEIVFYMLNNAQADLLEYREALDNEIMQKILPRIQGSSAAVKDLLCRLFQKVAGDYTGFSRDVVWKQMDAYLEGRDCVYRNSAQKICYMMRRYEEDGFTSYWL